MSNAGPIAGKEDIFESRHTEKFRAFVGAHGDPRGRILAGAVSKWALLLVAALTISLALPPLHSASTGESLMYIGTYTRRESKGVYAYRFQATTGALTSLGLVAETANPTWISLHPNGRFLYAANEGRDWSQGAGSASAFSIDAKTGILTFLNRVAARGSPCHVIVEKTGRCLIAANFGGGSVVAFPVKQDGSLGEASAFVQHEGKSVGPWQQGPHPHEAHLSPDHRFVFVPDMGLDKVFSYHLDPVNATLTENAPAFVAITPGSGPRHMEFHPNGRYAYVNSEMGSLVTMFAYDDGQGSLENLQVISTLPGGFTGKNNTAEIEVHPNGRFVYVSNRGLDTIAVFRVDPRDGKLTLVEHISTQGKAPRSFAIDPSGTYLFVANEHSDTIVQFRINQDSGRLIPTGTVLKVSAPVCLLFLPVR